MVYDGKKKSKAPDGGTPGRYSRKPKAVHVEFPKLQASKGSEAIQKAIKSALFASFYRGSIKFVPWFDHNVSVSNQTKIGKAITRHGHLEQRTEQFELIRLVNMDTIDKTSGLTPRQMMPTFQPTVTNHKIPLI